MWSNFIPPSKYFLIWRLFSDKLFTDEHLKKWSFPFPSQCNLCHPSKESTQHLFFNCQYVSKIWFWLIFNLNFCICFYCLDDVWQVFKDKVILVSFSFSFVLSACSLARNNSKTTSHVNIHDFVYLKFFKVSLRPPKAPWILEVIWKPPLCGWIKINCEGASLNNHGPFASGGIAWNYDGNFFGSFASFLNVYNSLIVKLFGAMQ